jgi:hypothetical protein
MSYETSFQCPDTGAPVRTTYAFGRLSATPGFDDTPFSWWLEGEQVKRENDGCTLEEMVAKAQATQDDYEARTLSWCHLVSGRCGSVEEANRRLRRHGVDGYDLLERAG